MTPDTKEKFKVKARLLREAARLGWPVTKIRQPKPKKRGHEW